MNFRVAPQFGVLTQLQCDMCGCNVAEGDLAVQLAVDFMSYDLCRACTSRVYRALGLALCPAKT